MVPGGRFRDGLHIPSLIIQLDRPDLEWAAPFRHNTSYDILRVARHDPAGDALRSDSAGGKEAAASGGCGMLAK